MQTGQVAELAGEGAKASSNPADPQENRISAERALEEVQGRAVRLSELERDRDALLASYEALALEELDDLTPEEHNGFYRTLRMIVYINREGGVELTGEFLFFGPSGPGGNGGDSATRRGFPTDIDTRGYGAGARALQ